MKLRTPALSSIILRLDIPQIRYLRTAIFDPRQSQPGGSPIDMLVVHRPGTAIKAAKAASQI